jgi:hypothetical protein
MEPTLMIPNNFTDLVEAYFWTLSIVWCPINQKLLDQKLTPPTKKKTIPTVKEQT